MPETNLDRALGRVEGKLDGVLTSIASINTTLVEDRQRAAMSRAAMSERIEGTEHGIESIQHRIAAIEKGIEEIKPLADEVRAWKQRGIGAAGILTALGAIFGGAIVAFRDRILTALGIGG
jgi:uncharacterized phage infection (PIP) family protein YhgE